jgi:hypothetical protein
VNFVGFLFHVLQIDSCNAYQWRSHGGGMSRFLFSSSSNAGWVASASWCIDKIEGEVALLSVQGLADHIYEWCFFLCKICIIYIVTNFIQLYRHVILHKIIWFLCVRHEHSRMSIKINVWSIWIFKILNMYKYHSYYP